MSNTSAQISSNTNNHYIMKYISILLVSLLLSFNVQAEIENREFLTHTGECDGNAQIFNNDQCCASGVLGKDNGILIFNCDVLKTAKVTPMVNPIKIARKIIFNVLYIPSFRKG